MRHNIRANISRDEVFRALKEELGPDGLRLVRVLLETAVATCDEQFKLTGAFPFWFTDHGSSHSDRVLYYALALAARLPPHSRLSPKELFFLAAACYLHDIGMASPPPGTDLHHGYTSEVIDQVRKQHPFAVRRLISDKKALTARLSEIDPLASSAFPDLCEAHSTGLFRDRLIRLQSVEAADMRLTLIGRILLLADELDVTCLRVSMKHPVVTEAANGTKFWIITERDRSLTTVLLPEDY